MKFRSNAPAFQEYAADMLANRNYRTMSLAERGLLDTLRRECWVSGSVPSDIAEMAKILGYPEAEIALAFTKSVSSFFELIDTDLIAPDLEKYRVELAQRKQKMAAGGRTGGIKTQERNRSTPDQTTTLKPPFSLAKAPEKRGEELSGSECKRIDLS